MKWIISNGAFAESRHRSIDFCSAHNWFKFTIKLPGNRIRLQPIAFLFDAFKIPIWENINRTLKNLKSSRQTELKDRFNVNFEMFQIMIEYFIWDNQKEWFIIESIDKI